MSETIHTEAEAMPARQIKARAAAWLERRHFWDWSAEDQAALDAWRAESSAHEVAYLRMEAAWSRTERLAALRPSENENSVPSRNSSRLLSRAVAGVAMAAVLVVAGAYYISRPDEKVYATALGGHQTVTLADGTSRSTPIRFCAFKLARTQGWCRWTAARPIYRSSMTPRVPLW
jgi:transmembrane sensor